MPLHSGQPSCCGPWSEVAWPCRAFCSECRVFVWYPVLLSVPAKPLSQILTRILLLWGAGVSRVFWVGSRVHSTHCSESHAPALIDGWAYGFFEALQLQAECAGGLIIIDHCSCRGAFAKLPLWGTLGSFDAEKPNNIFFFLFLDLCL